MQSDTNDKLAEFFTGIIDASIAHIVKHEDPQKFLLWFEQEALGHYARNDDLFETQQDTQSLAHSMGRAIWNSVPLPGNGFRPRPLPALRRNDPCPCRSGRKFKRCCGGGNSRSDGRFADAEGSSDNGDNGRRTAGEPLPDTTALDPGTGN